MEKNESKWIIANWKMNGDFAFAEKYIEGMLPTLAKTRHHVVICPPYACALYLLSYLDEMDDENEEKPKNPLFSVGAQNCHEKVSGAFTGETSVSSLVDMGCQYVILGHSERRTFCGETSELVSRKAKTALEHQITPIICVGESLEQRESGSAIDVILSQIAASLPTDLHQPILLAYEPIWAIGTGNTATLEDILHVYQAIKAKYPSLPVLYGGSVSVQNAQELLSIVDGLLIGGASLQVEAFSQICLI